MKNYKLFDGTGWSKQALAADDWYAKLHRDQIASERARDEWLGEGCNRIWERQREHAARLHRAIRCAKDAGMFAEISA